MKAGVPSLRQRPAWRSCNSREASADPRWAGRPYRHSRSRVRWHHGRRPARLRQCRGGVWRMEWVLLRLVRTSVAEPLVDALLRCLRSLADRPVPASTGRWPTAWSGEQSHGSHQRRCWLFSRRRAADWLVATSASTGRGACWRRVGRRPGKHCARCRIRQSSSWTPVAADCWFDLLRVASASSPRTAVDPSLAASLRAPDARVWRVRGLAR
jgi:hypothetical protein